MPEDLQVAGGMGDVVRRPRPSEIGAERLHPADEVRPGPVLRGSQAVAGLILLAAPILAVTCWAQLRIVAHAIPPVAISHPPAVYPLIAQLTGWCAVAVAAAACVDRSRHADLGGAIAAPVSFAAIALAWYAPVTSRFLTEPYATAHGVTVAWYAIAAAALAVTGAAMRDQWHHFTRDLHRLSWLQRKPS